MVIRSKHVSWVLIAAAFAVASCAPPAAVPTPTALPSAPPTGATAAPGSAAPVSPGVASPGASGVPSTAPAGSPTPAASATATPPATYETGILRGSVYDAATELVPDGTTVTVKSLDATRPFDGSAKTSSGAYVLNGVPLNTQVSVTATRPGWTSRTQVGVVRPYDQRFESTNVFNFGGKVVLGDSRGISHFLSDHPEIARVEPTDKDSSGSRDRMSFKLTMSEPLDSENRRRLSAAFLIVPNNDEAIGEDMAIPDLVEDDEELEGLRIADPDDDATDAAITYPYAYRQNAGFLDGAETANFMWDEAGLTATFTLEAPVKTDRNDEGEYAFILRQRDDDPIVDADNNAFGMNKDGEFGETTEGDIIYNAIAEPAVNLTEGFDDEEERWADTHLSFTRFSVEEDTEAPKLVSVVARRNFVDDEGDGVDRIELTFSEPMVAYPRITSRGLLSLDNYVLSAAATEKELDARDLDDGSADEVSTGADGEDVRDAFDGAVGIRVASDRAEAGNFKVSLSVRNPKVVILALPPGSFPLDADFIKVLAGSDADRDNAEANVVADPADNVIAESGKAMTGQIQ